MVSNDELEALKGIWSIQPFLHELSGLTTAIFSSGCTGEPEKSNQSMIR